MITWYTFHNSGGNMGAYSADQGITWTNFGSYPASGYGGVIAIAANAGCMVWAPDGGAAVSYSTNNGSTWTASTGINTGVYPEADRVNSNKFYAYDATNGNVLASTNGGVSFSTAATGFTAVPSWNLWASDINGSEIYRSAVVQVQEGHNTIAVTELLQQPSGVYYAEVLTADSGTRIGSVRVVRQ